MDSLSCRWFCSCHFIRRRSRESRLSWPARSNSAKTSVGCISAQALGMNMYLIPLIRTELPNRLRKATATLATRIMALVVICLVGACHSASSDDNIGVGITGIDHLADHLSIQDFWVDGYNAAQAGKGGSLVCCATIPRVWRPGILIKVRWSILDWTKSRGTFHEAVVPLEQYDEPGTLWIHFLADGSVRAISSGVGPGNPDYPGPRDPIPQKHPWDVYSLKP